MFKYFKNLKVQTITNSNTFKLSNMFKLSSYKFSSIDSDNDIEKENIIFKKYNAVFKFNNRKVVSVTGEDAESFLQSMISNDIKKLKDDDVAMSSLFLTPKGRIQMDSIIVKSHFSNQKYPEYWIDVHEQNKDELINHLTSHCLRKKVDIEDLSGFLDVYGAISLLVGSEPENVAEGKIWKQLQDTAHYEPSEENPEVKVTDSMAFIDPRLKSLGCRVICPTDSLEFETDTINLKLNSNDYEAIRLLYGVLEGPSEVRDQFPLNLNFHHLNAINFNKGCYIGQELTQRTYHTGVIRKVAMPFVITEKLTFKIGDETNEQFQGHVIIPYQSLNKKFNQSLKGKNILDTNGNVIGVVITNKYNCGIAMIEKELLETSKIAKFNIEGMNTIIYDPNSLWDSVRDITQEMENKK